MTEYLRRLLTAEDKFAFVLSDSLVYRLSGDTHDLALLRALLHTPEITARDRVLSELAIIFGARRADW